MQKKEEKAKRSRTYDSSVNTQLHHKPDYNLIMVVCLIYGILLLPSSVDGSLGFKQN